MKRINMRFLFSVFMILVILAVSACSSKDDGEEESATSNEVEPTTEKNEIKIRSRDDPDFLDPHMIEASITEQMMLNVFEGLLAPNEDGTLKEAIAEGYEISEDGLTYTFTLREGVKFHNGDEVTADDVVYSFNRLTGKDNDEPLSSDFDGVESIEAAADDTVVITLSEVDSTFLAYLTAKDAAIIPENNDEDHNTHPIGTGPFQFVSYSPGSDLILEKNEDYWIEGIPYLEKATFVFQSDDEAAFLSLQADEIDLMEVSAHRIPELENDYELEFQDNNSTMLIGFNHEEEPFDNEKVRQAINHAINKDDVLEATFSGYATKIGSNMSPAMGAYYKEGLEDYYEYDIEKAKDLLEEAGYPDGFKTTISISSHTERYTDIAQVAAENLKDIGIDVEIEVVEWGVWLERIYQGREFEMTAIDFTGKLTPYEDRKSVV